MILDIPTLYTIVVMFAVFVVTMVILADKIKAEFTDSHRVQFDLTTLKDVKKCLGNYPQLKEVDEQVDGIKFLTKFNPHNFKVIKESIR